MAQPTLDRLLTTLDATWPAAAVVEAGPWTLREGRGGGKRVSATTIRGPWRQDDVGAAESAMKLLGQEPLFMIRHGESDLDHFLADQGYDSVDTTNLWLADIDLLCDRKLPPVTAFTVWEPLAIMREIWVAGGVDQARQNVMDRVKGPKAGIFGRVSDAPGGAGFCAIHDGIAMVHALEIKEEHRGKGLGAWMMRRAAMWAKSQGARWITLAATQQNTAATNLYNTLQMQVVGQYHYRRLNDPNSETA